MPAVHAGWRGLESGIVEATIEQMETKSQQLLAWIGPGISQTHFEVGDEVRASASQRGMLVRLATNKPARFPKALLDRFQEQNAATEA